MFIWCSRNISYYYHVETNFDQFNASPLNNSIVFFLLVHHSGPNKDNVINTRITLDRYVHQVISTLIISNLNIPINYIATSHLADPVNLVSYSKNRSAIDPDFGKPKPKVWHESQSLLR